VPQVVVDRRSVKAEHVELPGSIASDDPPGAERLREAERHPAGPLCHVPGHRFRGPVDGHVEVSGLAREQPVTHRTADQPGGRVDVGQCGQRITHCTGSPSR